MYRYVLLYIRRVNKDQSFIGAVWKMKKKQKKKKYIYMGKAQNLAEFKRKIKFTEELRS